MENKKNYKKVVKAYRNTGKKTDPNGSYTGNTDSKKAEVPVQDADDL